ncbi:metadherin a isoform X1 [Anguilla rostrata]|uniref:metadherin a isoform X1 n=1 Tax=Anguilla rostrata TaxID=7938 RepID=UPI0030D01736
MVSEAKMAKSWQDVVIQQAELISSRLRELLSSGLGLLRSELGVDLGLKPELYPSWVILLTAVIGLLLIVFSWAAACNGLFGGRKRGARANEDISDSTNDLVTKIVKTEDQKKRNKKKPNEKKTQSNGGTPPELQEADQVTEEIPKPSPDIKAEKAKKNKKKPKTEAKSVVNASSPDGKEPDEGAWETKVSNREKRQQRRKDKAPGDESGSPGGADPPLRAPAEQPAVPAPAPAPTGLRKSRGEPPHVKHGKGEAVLSQVTANWSEPLAVNGGGWNDMAMKLPSQMSSLDGEKWPNIPKEPPHAWGPEAAGSWSGLDGRLKKDLNPVSLPVIGLNTTGEEPVSQPAAVLQCYSQPPVDDQWSGLNGMGDVDPSSDWNPPSELWGNYEEPQPEISAPPKDSAPEAVKASDDEKEKGDASKGDGKSKKKKKKKKKQEDAGAALQESEEPEKEAAEELRPPVQETLRYGTPALVDESLSQKPSSQVPHRLPEPETLLPTAKQNSTPPSSQKKSEENWEPPKQVQKKKKARRET